MESEKDGSEGIWGIRHLQHSEEKRLITNIERKVGQSTQDNKNRCNSQDEATADGIEREAECWKG